MYRRAVRVALSSDYGRSPLYSIPGDYNETTTKKRAVPADKRASIRRGEERKKGREVDKKKRKRGEGGGGPR